MSFLDLFAQWFRPAPEVNLAEPSLSDEEQDLLRKLVANEVFERLIRKVTTYEARAHDDYTRGALNSGMVDEANRSAASAQTFLDVWIVLKKHAAGPTRP